jgi:serine/threonine protein kinase
MTTVIGTEKYMAPELTYNQNCAYTDKIDIWSLGIIIDELWNTKVTVDIQNLQNHRYWSPKTMNLEI